MPKGEKVLAQSKRTAPPPILKFLKEVFNWLVKIFTLLSIGKTLLNTKRRISFRGSFVLVKGKAFEIGGENFES
jgi:hypothetical protein